MKDDAAQVKQLLAPFRDRPVAVDAERLAARRARSIAAIEREVRGVAAQRQSRKRRIAQVGLLLAAGVALAFGVRRLGEQRVPAPPLAITFVGSVGQTIAHGRQTPRQLRPGEALTVDPGEIETAAEGSAELVAESGLGLRLGVATRVSLAPLLEQSKQQVELRQGVLTCTVPHLNEGQHFSVQTPDARVVVHGTVFSVHVDGSLALGSKTCVEVSDGVVVVQHDGTETALNAGERWGCPSVAVPAPTAASSELPTRPAVVTSSSSSSSLPVVTARAPERGTLGEESRLLQGALAAERLGQRALAQRLLQQLLSRYPSSPLLPEARRAQSRISEAAVAP